MARVTAEGGTVATCFWDLPRMPTLNVFWAAAATIDGRDLCDLRRPGSGPGELAELLGQAGLHDVRESVLTASSRYGDFDEWWRAFTFGAGPAGQHYQSLNDDDRLRLRDACFEMLGDPAASFTLTAHAWCAVATVKME